MSEKIVTLTRKNIKRAESVICNISRGNVKPDESVVLNRFIIQPVNNMETVLKKMRLLGGEAWDVDEDFVYVETSSDGFLLAEANTIEIKELDHLFCGCEFFRALSFEGNVRIDCTSMRSTFAGCSALVTAPDIPRSAGYIPCTFRGCVSMTGTLRIDADARWYANCLWDAATKKGANLKFIGSCEKLAEILETGSANSHIAFE